MVLRIFLLALGYVVAGRLGLLLAIPPGYAATFWPAAGIALGGVLVFGYRAWPGVWFGSFLVNLGVSFDDHSLAAKILSIVLPFCIGVGAALQAVVGAWLVRRYVGYPNPLNRERDVALLLVIAGPLSSVINASVGVSLLWLASRIQGSEAAFSWWVWWVGDTVGAFLVTPLMLLWTTRTQRDWPRRPIMVSVPLAILVALVVGLFWLVELRERDRLHAAFDFQTASLARALENRLDRIQEAVYGMRSFRGEHPSSEGGRKFASLAEATLKRRQSILAFVWAPRVRDAERLAFEEARRLSEPGWEIREMNARDEVVRATHRSEYYPMLYRQPSPENARYFGFDMAFDADRRQALLRAGETSHAIASLPIRGTRQYADHKFILIFMAIYRNGAPPEHVEERADAILGYIVAPLKVSTLVELAWRDLRTDGIDFWFYDDAASPDKRLALFRKDAHGSTEEPTDETIAAMATQVRNIPIHGAGRQWTLKFVQTPEYLAANRSLQAWTVLAGGMLFTGVLGSVLLAATGRASLITTVVEERTAELAQANQAMAQEIRERQRIEQSLRESEERFRLLVEGTTDYAIYMLDPRGNIVSWNAAAERMKGYAAAEVIGNHFQRFFAPEDAQRGMPQEHLALAEQSGRYEVEGWRIRKDGSRLWVNAIVTALRDGDGRLRGFLKITRDVTARREAEESQRRMQEKLDENRRFIEHVAEMMPSILFVYDLEQERNIFVNRRVESVLGYATAEVMRPGPSIFAEAAHPDDRAKLELASERYQTAEDDEIIEIEYRLRHASGAWRWVHSRNMIFKRDAEGNSCQILGTLEDITDKKQLEQEVIEIAAGEQRRLGQELHDGTGQELTGLCMLADNLADALRERDPSEESLARRIAQGVRQSLGQVRALSRGLIPVEVDAEGLMAALTELTNRISATHGITCVFECHESVPIEDNYTATQLFRIAQEAITNALKHAQPANIRVSLEAKGYYVTLKIVDDGVGVLDGKPADSGMGLHIMRYRAGQIGAQFSIRPGTQRGTVVTCTFFRGTVHD